ncbi:MAG TPA: hypothetical protein VIX80_09240, partial [Candidatus Kapabacteria bacterium]
MKCGTPRQIKEFLSRKEKKQTPQLYPLPPKLSDSIVSPSGRFRIHFNVVGDSSASNEYVNAVAALADEAYQLEVVELNYPKPAYTFSDSMWHIYIVDFPSAIYGFTSPIESGLLGVSPSGLN